MRSISRQAYGVIHKYNPLVILSLLKMMLSSRAVLAYLKENYRELMLIFNADI